MPSSPSPLSPSPKETLIFGIAAVAAISVGVWIAQGSWLAVVFVSAAIVFGSLGYLAPVKTHVVTIGVLIIGYIIGNRGFAQLTPASGAPLFPAELGLILSGGLLVAQSCVSRRVPVYRDSLNFSVLLWMAFATARVPFDVKSYGFAALRDFALVYYAAFMFIAQTIFVDRDKPSRWLHQCILWSTAPLPVLLYLFNNYGEIFTQRLTFRDIPLIYYKGDLVGTFLAVGSVAWYLFYAENRRRWWALLLSLALAGAVLTTDNRASLLALLVCSLWLGIGRRWQFFGLLAGGAFAAILALLIWGQFAEKRFEDTPVQRLYENIASLTDVQGARHYSGLYQKGDNNRFRLVWWETAVNDTLHTNPWVGVGFGYDLADEFLKAYYPDSGDDFNVRSPHNVWVTIFARMGLVGLLAFVAIATALGFATAPAVRASAPVHHALPWCVAWAILTASTFGVVLEGPMGAVVFWVSVGVGNAERLRSQRALEQTTSADRVERLSLGAQSP